MQGYQNLKRQLLPLVKGLPYVVLCFLLALFIAEKLITYSPNVYQTIAKIKLDDQKYGFSGNNLYSDFDMFSSENKIEAEAEILKSPLLIRRVIDTLDIQTLIYRKGSIKNTMLYNDSPISISYEFENEDYFDKQFQLKVVNEKKYKLVYTRTGANKVLWGSFGKDLKLNKGTIRIVKNVQNIQGKGVQLEGEYLFKIFSKETLIEYIAAKLDVKPVEKDVAVLRVVYTEEHPHKVADLVNALCDAYIHDYVVTKSSAANQTVKFIDKKLLEVGDQLSRAEVELEQFKMDKDVVNTRQQTETGLREISKLKVQLFNLEMNEEAIRRLQTYIDNGEYFDETAISFGFGDLLMTELVKKLKLWQDERHDLLVKYKADHEKVKAVDNKIAEVKKYVKEGVLQNLKEIELKRSEIMAVVEEESHMFDNLPTREKNHQILLRNFHLLENVYNFLSQKKIEASIASSANLSFHRVIQPATIPDSPVSPNRTLITFVAGLLGLIIGITFIYLKKYVRAKVSSKMDIERHSMLPVLGIVRNRKEEDFASIIRALLVKGITKKGDTLTVCSTLSGEGKTHFVKGLSSAMHALGFKVRVIDYSQEKQSNNYGTVEAIKEDGVLTNERLEELKEGVDFTIIDSVASAVNIAGVEAMKLAQTTLYLCRVNHTAIGYVSQPDLLLEEYELKNIHWVLNGAHKATNYTGHYIGARFQNKSNSKGLLGKMKYYYITYIKS